MTAVEFEKDLQDALSDGRARAYYLSELSLEWDGDEDCFAVTTMLEGEPVGFVQTRLSGSFWRTRLGQWTPAGSLVDALAAVGDHWDEDRYYLRLHLTRDLSLEEFDALERRTTRRSASRKMEGLWSPSRN